MLYKKGGYDEFLSRKLEHSYISLHDKVVQPSWFWWLAIKSRKFQIVSGFKLWLAFSSTLSKEGAKKLDVSFLMKIF